MAGMMSSTFWKTPMLSISSNVPLCRLADSLTFESCCDKRKRHHANAETFGHHQRHSCFHRSLCSLIEHTSLVADPQLDRISKFTEIDGKIQHLVAPNHRVALSKVEPCRPV